VNVEQLRRKQRLALCRLLLARREGIEPVGVHPLTWASLRKLDLVWRRLDLGADGQWRLTDRGDILAHQALHALYLQASAHLPLDADDERRRVQVAAGLELTGYQPVPAVGQVWVNDTGVRLRIERIGPTINGWQAAILWFPDGAQPFGSRMYIKHLVRWCRLLRVCCDLHGQHCEPPGDLCCYACTEVNHPDHPAGVACVLLVTASSVVTHEVDPR